MTWVAPTTTRELLILGSDALHAVDDLVRSMGESDRLHEARQLGAILMPSPQDFAPVIDPQKVLCTGLNYLGHAEEVGKRAPTAPEVFLRVARSLCGPFDTVAINERSRQLDWEGELAVIIGRSGRDIAEADAFDHVAGYAVFNDLTIRDWQHLGSQWTPGKNFDGTGPIGPWLVTADEAGHQNRRLVTKVNGEVVQEGWTDDMVHSIPELIAFCSAFTTLDEGDVIATGTPSGTGFKRTPPRFLRPSDIVAVEIDGIGRLENQVIEA